MYLKKKKIIEHGTLNLVALQCQNEFRTTWKLIFHRDQKGFDLQVEAFVDIINLRVQNLDIKLNHILDNMSKKCQLDL